MSSADVTKIYADDPELKPADVRALLDWANKQPHLPKITELQAILFLQSCYYSNEFAKTTLDTYLTVKSLCPDIFGNRNPDDATVKHGLSVAAINILPKTTPEGYKVVFMKLVNCEPMEYIFSEQVRNFDMITMLHLHKYGPAKGLILVFDMDGCVFGHLTRLNIVVMKKLLYYLQDAMPIRLIGLHFINVVPFMDKILALMKPFMKKALMESLHVHKDSIESFYKFVPKECLPQEYGGQSEPVNILHEKAKQLINDNGEYFKFEESQVVNENKRPGKPKNIGDYFGMEGTFKKLEVD